MGATGTVAAQVFRHAFRQTAQLRPCRSVPGNLRTQLSHLSTDTHEDFKPQAKGGASLGVFDAIKEDVTTNRVMLYMKGFPDQPMCGFSARVVALLRGYGIAFESRNVLEDNELREGIKKYSNWPTIPQVYCDGEFLGGCDVLWEAHEAGEFPALFKPADAGQAA